MNGPEHYRKAEQLLAGQPKTAANRERGFVGDEPWEPTETELRKAQIHATLALAAATALNDYEGGMSSPDYNRWMNVASVKRGHRNGGLLMTAVARLTVVYGRGDDVYDAATAADSALEGRGVRVMIERNELGGFGVWLVKRDDPTELGRWFLPGQQLVVSYDDGWWIEDVAGPEVAA